MPDPLTGNTVTQAGAPDTDQDAFAEIATSKFPAKAPTSTFVLSIEI